MALPTLWRPWRREVAERRPESLLDELQRDVNRLFEQFWREPMLPAFFEESWDRFTPRVDVEETDEEVRVTAELPGLEEKDFELHLGEDELVLSGEKQVEHDDRRRGRWERSYGRFYRSIPLPCEVDGERASARFKNGVLTVTLPKAPEARARMKRIAVQAA